MEGVSPGELSGTVAREVIAGCLTSILQEIPLLVPDLGACVRLFQWEVAMGRRAVGTSLAFFSASLFYSSPLSGQTLIHNRLVSTPSGVVEGLFEVTGGVAVQIPTGLTNNTFPSVSQDGRYILISAADPLFPNDPSGDVFVFDRANGQTQKVIDHDTETALNGSIFFRTPLYSALSPNNELIAMATQEATSPGGTRRVLSVYRASDGFPLGNAAEGEVSSPTAPPSVLFRPEFHGVSWSPDGRFFASPAFVNTITNASIPLLSGGIVLYGIDPVSQRFGKLHEVTHPQAIVIGPNIIAETHALPVFSPDGQRLAFFSITYPDPFLAGPATAELFTVNVDGTNRRSVLRFEPGQFPGGLSWTPDGSELVFSIMQQVQQPGLPRFPAQGDTSTAVLGFINANGGTPGGIPGAPFGFFPSVILESGPIPGDYNRDGSVDVADYFAWGATFGAAVPPGTGADGNGGGFIDAADYVVWRKAAGSGSAAGDAISTAPEPTAGVLLLYGIIALLSSRRSVHRRAILCRCT
jgi:hypothetical protein